MRKFVLMLFAAVMLCISADNSPQQKYISKYAQAAVSEMHRSGVPASITLAQGILESRSGLSALAAEGNNHFGIKCHRDWKGKTMKVDDDRKGECFRVYDSASESFRDHSDFLRYQDRYRSLFSLDPKDYKGWANGLKAAGYATDKAYAGKLIKIIEDYELYKFDDGVAIEIETPDELEQVHQVKFDHNPLSTKYKEYHKVSLRRPVYEKNGVMFVLAREGETYQMIAADYELFGKEILRFNDLPKKSTSVPQTGEVVYIQQKKKKAAKGIEKYIVGSDPESLRDICQRFAVRMDAVVKLNRLSKDYKPEEGDTILLR